MTHGTAIPLPNPSAPTPDHLLKASATTVSYDSLNSGHAHFTISANGPLDPLTVPELSQDHQKPLRVTASYTQNALKTVRTLGLGA